MVWCVCVCVCGSQCVTHPLGVRPCLISLAVHLLWGVRLTFKTDPRPSRHWDSKCFGTRVPCQEVASSGTGTPKASYLFSSPKYSALLSMFLEQMCWQIPTCFSHGLTSDPDLQLRILRSPRVHGSLLSQTSALLNRTNKFPPLRREDAHWGFTCMFWIHRIVVLV